MKKLIRGALLMLLLLVAGIASANTTGHHLYSHSNDIIIRDLASLSNLPDNDRTYDVWLEHVNCNLSESAYSHAADSLKKAFGTSYEVADMSYAVEQVRNQQKQVLFYKTLSTSTFKDKYKEHVASFTGWRFIFRKNPSNGGPSYNEIQSWTPPQHRGGSDETETRVGPASYKFPAQDTLRVEPANGGAFKTVIDVEVTENWHGDLTNNDITIKVNNGEKIEIKSSYLKLKESEKIVSITVSFINPGKFKVSLNKEHGSNESAGQTYTVTSKMISLAVNSSINVDRGTKTDLNTSLNKNNGAKIGATEISGISNPSSANSLYYPLNIRGVLCKKPKFLGYNKVMNKDQFEYMFEFETGELNKIDDTFKGTLVHADPNGNYYETGLRVSKFGENSGTVRLYFSCSPFTKFSAKLRIKGVDCGTYDITPLKYNFPAKPTIKKEGDKIRTIIVIPIENLCDGMIKKGEIKINTSQGLSYTIDKYSSSSNSIRLELLWNKSGSFKILLPPIGIGSYRPFESPEYTIPRY